MYPHIIITFNIERNCMIGKLFIDGFYEEMYDHIFVDNSIYDNSGDDEDDDDIDEPECLKKYDAGRDFVDNYLTSDTISIGTKWFNLPDYENILIDFKQEFNIKPRRKISLKSVARFISDKLRIEVK